MRRGLVVRADDTGLGVQSWEAYRALQPEATLLVEMGAGAHRQFETHYERYPDATRVTYANGRLPEAETRAWLEGLDCAISFECFYDPDFYDWAEDAGVATCLQVNAELLRPLEVYPQRPSAWWAPTSWRLDSLPAGTRVVPVPVADDRFTFRIPERDGPLRVLYVDGHSALADRNGSQIMTDAIWRVTEPMRVTMATQERRPLRMPGRRARQQVEVVAKAGGVANYWDLYAGQDVLVLPRRYGGLSLVAQEAMASGLAVVMSDCEPQRSTWPIIGVPGSLGDPVRMLCGKVQPFDSDPVALARVLDELAADPERVKAAQIASLRWAMQHRWSVLAPMYNAELERACARP